MTTTVLFADSPEKWHEWQPHLRTALDARNLDICLTTDRNAADISYIIYAPSSGMTDFTAFPKLRAVFSMWAGVETITPNTSLTVPLARMVDPGLTAGMTQWVLGHVMRHHLGMDQHITRQDGVWRGDIVAPLASTRSVGIPGMGALGQAAAGALLGAGFQVHGWSRTQRAVPHVTCHHGAEGLKDILAVSDILVLLLPDTPQTDGLLNAERLAALPDQAVIINPGRGPLIVDDALLAALDRGHIAHATLDVFRTEPLPADHPFWAHPKVTVTPHIAAATPPETASEVIADNLARALSGRPILHLVDREAGY